MNCLYFCVLSIILVSKNINSLNISCNYLISNTINPFFNVISINGFKSIKEIILDCDFQYFNLTALYSFEFVSDRKIIFDNPLNFNNFDLFKNNDFDIDFSILKGFSVNTSILSNTFSSYDKVSISFTVSHIDFYFYNNEQLINDLFCLTVNNSLNIFSNISVLGLDVAVRFLKTEYCPYVFNNSDMSLLYIYSLYDTYTLKNYLYFMTLNHTVRHKSIIPHLNVKQYEFKNFST